MEPVPASEQAINEPASPPARDSMEDADASLTRKRPRLDSGSRETRSMSQDPTPPPNGTGVSTPEPIMTINTRSHPPSSSQAGDGAADDYTAGPTLESDVEADADAHGSPVADTAASQLPDAADPADAALDSPPVIAVDDDDDTQLAMAESVEAEADYIQVDEDEEAYFRSFPYTAGQGGNYFDAVRVVAQHIQKGAAIEGSVLPTVTQWLEQFPHKPSQYKRYYVDKLYFWDAIAQLACNLLKRRLESARLASSKSANAARQNFGETFCEGLENEEEIVESFLQSYVKLCARLLQADVQTLQDWSDEDPYGRPLLSSSHLDSLQGLLEPGRFNVFHLLSKEYGVDIRDLSLRLLGEFIAFPSRGAQHLFSLADAVRAKIPEPNRSLIILGALSCLTSMGWRMRELVAVDKIIDRQQFYHNVLHFLRASDKDLQEPSKKQATKEMLLGSTWLLQGLCQWDERTAATLMEEFVDFGDPESPSTLAPDTDSQTRLELLRQERQHFPALVANAWRFKLLRKYVVKGRMDLRVMSITAMDNALVEIWKEYNGSEQGMDHPVLQYLADFLLRTKVTDYIISVDSHPQIISRSGNIVGFLVVTRRYGDEQTDAIWHTVANSQDPRVVSATMTMLGTITALMNLPEWQYVCTKLYDLPIESYTIEILKFLKDMIVKFRNKSGDWKTPNPKARPLNVCVRVIRETPPSRNSTKLSMALNNEASDMLRTLSSSVGLDDREAIYEDCAKHIASRSDRATGSVQAILLLWQTPQSFNDQYFRREPGVTRQILEEMCDFVETEKELGHHPLQANALQPRLDLLGLLVFRASDVIPSDFNEIIWDHLIGKHALEATRRDLSGPKDQAWTKFVEIFNRDPHNAFCAQLLTEYVPKLEPASFTTGLFAFIEITTKALPRVKQAPDGSGLAPLEIPGADLLWPLVLTAQPGTVEDRAARLLATRYVDVASAGASIQDVESAHIALAEQCNERLLDSFKTLRENDRMDISEDHEAHELRFTRTLLFEKLLLSIIRMKPIFSRTRRADSKCEAMEDVEAISGDAIEIKYQPAGGEKQSLYISPDSTFNDLYHRLCHACGFTKLNIFALGRRLHVPQGHVKISNLGLGDSPHLLVQKDRDGEIVPPVSDNASCSAFEAAVLSHFEELYACMDSDDRISEALFDFFSSFPFPERISEAVTLGQATQEDLFPPGKPFQARYAACALLAKLKEQLRKNSLNEQFLANSVRIMTEALLNESLISPSLQSTQDLPVAVDLVNALLELLKERPSQDASLRYFSDEMRFVGRLMAIMNACLKPDSNRCVAACASYGVILEASLHSMNVWQAFMQRGDIVAIHRELLLLDARTLLRERIAQYIASVCGGGLPSTSPLTGAQVAAQYWKVLSQMLEDATRYPGSSEQLFNIAEQVFRSHDEDSRDEIALRMYLDSWSTALLEYKHNQFIGRDDVDFVVLGFTKLLLCCIPSLRSFKKPLNASSLMQRVFEKFLFIPSFDDDNGALAEHQLPVLEPRTRKELYDLVLALVEDQASYDALLALAQNTVSEEENMVFSIVDRIQQIRSATGYVGLYNPRAICYMNSLLTQLFMNVNFRKFLLELNVADAEGSQRLLFETQSLFATMQDSYRKAADPRNFAACVKSLDSQPIDINVQMDADEFYNLLFDQWEGQMLSPEVKQRFRSFYGGQTIMQIKSKDCEHVSEKVEGFFVVQCDVSGKANLQESLQAFVEGDVMEGDNKYKCESCGGRFVDAVKRTCLKDVPDNLIFHLKRFDYDLSNGRRVKINDRFEFPETIDVSLYNVDYLSDPSKPQQEDLFELVGVLVHSGNSENGHYYSYIRERPNGNRASWVEFNDREVDKFDHAMIPQHAFGGMFEEQFQRNQKHYSAYMLFYQRKSAIADDYDQYLSSAHCGQPKVEVPSSIGKQIAADNESFVREYSLYDPNHSRFIRQLLVTLRTVNHGACSEDHEQEEKAICLVLEHLLQVISRLKECDYFDETLTQLRKTVLSCPTCCHSALKWFAHHRVAMAGLLLRCVHAKVRSQVRALLIDCLRFLREKDPMLYGLENGDNDMDTGSPTPSEGILEEVVHRLRLVADESSIGLRGWDDFYLTLCQLSNLGHFETGIMLNQNILRFCLSLLTMHVHPQFKLNQPELWQVVHKKRNIYNRLIELVYTLLSKMDLKKPDSTDRCPDRFQTFERMTQKFTLSPKEHALLTLWHDENKAIASLDKMIELFDTTKTEVFYPGEVLKLLLHSLNGVNHQHLLLTVSEVGTPDGGSRRKLSDCLFLTLSEGVRYLQPPAADPFVRASVAFCEASPSAAACQELIKLAIVEAGKLTQLGGEAYIYFFNALLTIQNPVVFEARHPDFFYCLLLSKARSFTATLLMYPDDAVRKAASKLVQDLVLRDVNDADNQPIEQTMRLKYDAMRSMMREFSRLIRAEHDAGTIRVFMEPMIRSCTFLVEQLRLLIQNDDPAVELYKDAADETIVEQYRMEVEDRLRLWVLDEDTPLSAGEAYEHSDYGSESDEGIDLDS